ncbi:MAG: TIGR02206 family membrane protein [Sandaracinaceae bacterium]
MPPAPFHPFGPLHAVTVAIVLGVIALVVGAGRRVGVERAKTGGRALGVLLLAYYIAEGCLRTFHMGVPAMLMIPGEICSALFFIGAFAFLTQNRVAYEVLFFWTFAGTLHSLITPTPLEGWPSLEYVRYFTTHGLLILSATYAVLALDRDMTRWSLVRAAIALQVWELIVAGVDLLLDQNFMYLRYPPPSPTLIDALGPWPVYLVSLEVVALLSFAVWLAILTLVRRVLPVREPTDGSAASAAVRSDGA